MMEFLKLIRWKNLLIVILTMIMMRYAIIAPLLGKMNIMMNDGSMMTGSLQMPWWNFLLLVFATVSITAGGYVINDYFDIKTDLINKGKAIVGTKIPRRKAMMWHNTFNAAGVATGFYVSWQAGYLWFGAIFLLVSGLLYFYSASYKRQFLIGNLIVALLTAMVPFMVAVFEWPALYRYYVVNAVEMPAINVILFWVGGFSVFAFITTLAREIIKDIEDFEGDLAYGRNTVPIVLGDVTARTLSAVLVFITISLLYVVWKLWLTDKITLIYITAAIALPLAWVIWCLSAGGNKKMMHSAGTAMKIAMITGTLYAVVVRIILSMNLV